MSALLRVGKMVGAARLTYVEVQQNSETPRGTATPLGVVAPIGGVWIATPPTSLNHSATLHHVRVVVRTVTVEDGTIRWTGTATSSKPIENPEAALGWLIEAAMTKALCPFEKGYEWTEAAPWRKNWGCIPPR